ncbi:MAG: dynamin family protein [Actinomycetota bacterium]
MSDASPPLVARALQVIRAARRATDAYGRADLGERLARAHDRLVRPDLQALVVGEFKKGKSTLINALLNIPLCPSSDEVATVVPTFVRHGDQPSASVVREDVSAQTATPRFEIPLDEISAWVSETGNADNAKGIRAVELRVPRRLLGSGLTLVDTPGVGGLCSVHGATTMAALGLAEVVIFVTDASQELTAVEMGVVRAATERCPKVVCVMTKTDLYPEWRRIADRDREHLAAAALETVEVIPVSSLLRERALAGSSKELNEESGYPALLRFLNEEVSGDAQRVTVRTALSDISFVIDQLQATFSAEHEVLADPSRSGPMLEELESARLRAEALRARTARWLQTLNDGCADLANDVDHDLRRRLREVLGHAEEAIDGCEPADVWEDFAPWLTQQVAEQVAANAEVLRANANRVARRVADHFTLDEEAVTHTVDTGGAPAYDARLEVDLDRSARSTNALAAVRGSYGGVLMFGMMGQLIGMTLVNPLTAVVGLGLGRKALRDERKRQLTLRRQQAKQAVRKYVDDASFAVGKESRDAVRRVQRDLRDEFSERAEQVQRSVRDALAATEAATRQTVEDAKARRLDLEAELVRIAKLRAATDELHRAVAGART